MAYIRRRQSGRWQATVSLSGGRRISQGGFRFPEQARRWADDAEQAILAVPSAFHASGSWHAVWSGPDLRRYSKPFPSREAAERHARAMQADAEMQREMAAAFALPPSRAEP
jgi:hypothetical protein